MLKIGLIIISQFYFLVQTVRFIDSKKYVRIKFVVFREGRINEKYSRK